MLGFDDANEFERKGLNGDLTKLPIIEKLIRRYQNYSSKGDIVHLVTKVEPNIFYIYDVCIQVMGDGTLRIQEKNSKEISITDETGVEVERVLEVTDNGERRLVRQDGVIREIFYSDQGARPVTGEVFLDNGDVEIKNAKGAKVRAEYGVPVYFNARDALKTFDENMLPLRNGTRKQQIYYRETRKRLEEAIQDEKISRLPFRDSVVALKELRKDLADENADLCDFIELDLAEHRNDLSVIKALQSVRWKFKPIDEIEAYRKKVAEIRSSLPFSTETDIEKGDTKPSSFTGETIEREDERLFREIYDYRKRNKALRQRRDVTTEMVEAMESVRTAVFDYDLPKGIFVAGILAKYQGQREKIVQDRNNKEEAVRKRKATIAKLRADKKAKAEFDRKMAERISPGKSTATIVQPKKEEDKEKDKKYGKFYTISGKG